MKIIKHDFYPKHFDESKENFQKFFLIEGNGDLVEKIMLVLPTERIREEIVCLHYLKYLVRNVYKENIGFNEISRDMPWDFKVKMSSNLSFFIEVTSIADNTDRFIYINKEASLFKFVQGREVTSRALRKMKNYFVKLEDCDDSSSDNIGKDELVSNPYYGQIPKLFISKLGMITKTLMDNLKETIDKKVNKNHADKGDTILLIDNRCVSFNFQDFQDALKLLENYIERLPFKEVWIYTGYCSNLDGNNAEYSLIRLK